ncbi:hypothetical protein CDD82_5610 [Ophiocordyceps australis]|uniref:DUF726 domain-containing protein n=1 Tax=Ophiocordyceps australis TaxID=1399860 RepID=A0A2C5Z1J4_9HYPO|nr:hypothetical protein CDD82_5610 [Ophiocordyceps australis]
MGRGGRGGHQTSLGRPVDLTGLISLAERNDLTTLVGAITDKMHNDIGAIFDSPPVTPVWSDHDHHHWLSLALFHRRHGDHKENNPSLVSSSLPMPKPKFVGDGSKVYSKAHGIVEKEETQAMTPQLCELKKEALTFFRKWQNAIIQRTRDIIVTDASSTSTAQANNVRGRGGRGFRGGPRGRGGRGPPRLPSTYLDRDFAHKFPPIPNTLWTLHIDKRKLLLHIVMLLVLSLQDFNANARIFLLNLASSINLSMSIFQTDERRIAQGLAKAAIEFAPDPEVGLKPEEIIKGPRRWKVGLPGSGMNANIIACLKSAGIGTINSGLSLSTTALAGLLGPMAEHGQTIGNLFGMSSMRPTSKMLETSTKEIQDFAFVRLHDAMHSEYRAPKEAPAADRRLRLVIALNGSISSDGDIYKPWRYLGRQAETYAMRWEVPALVNLGSALETATRSLAWEHARKEIMSRSIFSTLIDSSWPVALLKVSKVIDNPWGLGMVRAEKAGAVLADAIVRHKFQGERSVSLIGYGLAARAIYTCLMVLAERRQFGLIDSVVIMGAPAPSESRVWLTLKSVVSGRLVNVYSEHDYMLAFLFRTSNLHYGIAGLQEIQGAQGVENYRVKELPQGYLDYQKLTGRIFKDIGWEDLDVEAIKADQVHVMPDRSQRKPSGAKRGRGWGSRSRRGGSQSVRA